MGSARARSRRRNPTIAVALSACAVLAGCRAFERHRAELEAVAQAGRHDLAAAMLDDPRVRELYGSRSELLWELERGSAALYQGDPQLAVRLLDDAERRIDGRREKSLGDQLASWTINDAAASYIAEPYEDIYVNVLKLIAQLSAGNLDGGASVEARRLGPKADRLRDEYLRYRDGLEASSPRAARSGGLVAVNEEGEFLESPLGTYLAALTFMKLGEREYQRVAGRRLLSSIRLQGGLIGPVREEDFAGLDGMDPDAVNVVVVALSGRGPTKYPETVGPIPLGTVPVYFELPRLRVHPSVVASARVEVRAAESGGGPCRAGSGPRGSRSSRTWPRSPRRTIGGCSR